MTDLTAGVSSIGPHPARRSEAEARAEHDRMMFLLGVEFGVRASERGENLQMAKANARKEFEDSLP